MSPVVLGIKLALGMAGKHPPTELHPSVESLLWDEENISTYFKFKAVWGLWQFDKILTKLWLCLSFGFYLNSRYNFNISLFIRRIRRVLDSILLVLLAKQTTFKPRNILFVMESRIFMAHIFLKSWRGSWSRYRGFTLFIVQLWFSKKNLINLLIFRKKLTLLGVIITICIDS
jgi:hypothetical protein